MSAFVYPLEQAPEDPSSVGGKAAGLGRLLRAGLPVPGPASPSFRSRKSST